MSFIIPFLFDRDIFYAQGIFFVALLSSTTGLLQRDSFMENMQGKGNPPEESMRHV